MVRIGEDNFDFGGVTLGNSKSLAVTLHNESEIDAKLTIDLREFPEFEISLDENSLDDDDARSEIMQPVIEERPAGEVKDLDNI